MFKSPAFYEKYIKNEFSQYMLKHKNTCKLLQLEIEEVTTPISPLSCGS